jgi:hypothetical protein
MRYMILQRHLLRTKANSITIMSGQSNLSNKLSLESTDSTNTLIPQIKSKMKKYQCSGKNGFKEQLI